MTSEKDFENGETVWSPEDARSIDLLSYMREMSAMRDAVRGKLRESGLVSIRPILPIDASDQTKK